MSFDPNRNSSAFCAERLMKVTEALNLEQQSRVITSQDKIAIKAMEALEVDNIPKGFTKWQLPVYLNKESHMFLTVAEPGASVESHAHKEGDGIRFIVGGSIDYNGQVLTAGDWMFIPAGVEYGFDVGRFGASMCYCYCCCCA